MTASKRPHSSFNPNVRHMQMKTLQLVPAMEQGGVERGVVEVNCALVAAGWENVVVSAGGRLAKQIESDGGRHIALDVKSKNPLTYFSRAAKLRRILEVEKPNVVCAHSRVPAWLFLWANRRPGIKWISFAHGANSVSRYSEVMTFGDLTVTPSRYIADYLKANYGLEESRICVIPRAIDRDRFDAERLDRDFVDAKRSEWGIAGTKVVMGVGRITQLKGYDTLIKAVHRANGLCGGAPFKLVIVGEAEELRKEMAAMPRETEPAITKAPAAESEVAETPKESVYSITFRVDATRKQLIALKEACDRIGIRIMRV